MKVLYPVLSKWIEKLPQKAGRHLCNLMIAFMIFNCLISALALGRYEERQRADLGQEQEAAQGIDAFLDEHFPDERMERIYPNAKIVD